MITPPKTTLHQMLRAWQKQVHAAADKPWLFTLLMRQWARLFRRFAHYYQRLLATPYPHKHALKRTLTTTLAGAALLLALGHTLPAHAATITVDGVTCTLAEAIASANNDNAAGNGCVDGSGADVIDLQTDVLLSAALPAITSETTLEGNGHTLDGNNAFRVLNVQTSGDLTLNEATITGGGSVSDGGGINVYDGIVEVNNSIITGNSSFVYGGGIYVIGGTVTLNNSTISDNSAGDGGGILTFLGSVNITNSTLSGNTASLSGGGITNFYGGVTINNSTLSGNSASGSGGGVDLNHSLISGNAAPNGAEVNNDSSAVVNANNYNVVGYGGDARSVGFIPGPNDIIPLGALNTILDTTLANNGGPTLTHALLPGSAAIDAAPDTPCLAPPINGVDQRGFPRNVDGDGNPSNNECDAGALEFAPSGRPTKTPTSTEMPRPTRTPTPRPTRTPIPTIAAPGNAIISPPQEQSANPLLNIAVVTLLALGNLLLFRKWRT